MNEAAPAPRLPSSGHVLIVDDNAPFRHLLSAFLKKAHYTVLEAIDGQSALEALVYQKPDLIFLDLQMQPLGGFDFMKEYTALGHTIPVVLVTGDDSSDVLTMSTKLGFAGVLKKPVTEERILQIVRRFTAAA